ncbi:hypothetical protein TNCV_3656091 [Trichonephila clavipes]|nr:hypothetical protein TNCV_3656091 [Trichonephila clavipes]
MQASHLLRIEDLTLAKIPDAPGLPQRFCQAPELKAIHAPLTDVNPEMIQFQPRKVKRIIPTPVVYSVILFKMCDVLDIKAELHPQNERPTFVNKKESKLLWFILSQCNSMHSWQTPQTNRQKNNLKNM